MTSVNVSFGLDSPTHDLSLSDGSTTYGLIFDRGGIKQMQEIPLTPPAHPFAIEHKNWIGGRGRVRYVDDPTGFFDSEHLWSMTDGKLFPSLQWRYSDGLRSATTYMPGDNQTYTWWKLWGTSGSAPQGSSLYLETSFTPSANYTSIYYYLIVRRRGTPNGNLTVEVCSDSAGDPGTTLKTITKTTSDVTDTLAIHLPFTTSQALTGSTTYHIKVYGDASDDTSNHWEVLTNGDGSNSQQSYDDATYTAASVSLYYRVTDADTNRQYDFFTLEGGTYAVARNADLSASNLFINGVRGTATSATSTTLVDTNLAMTTDAFVGAYIRIYDGTGDGQVRQITANTATAFTVSAWGKTPDTTSRYIVYATDYWTEITSTGLSRTYHAPVVADNIVYFPSSSPIRRMRVNGSSHDFADDVATGVSHLYLNPEGNTPLIYGVNTSTSRIRSAKTSTWGTNLSFGSNKAIGGSDYKITNLFNHNKRLHIFKEDGLYTYSNNVVERLGNFGDVPDERMGIGVASKDNQLWFGWGHSIEKMTGASITDMMNWKFGYDGMGDTKKGYVSAIVSAVGWLFVAIDGGSDHYSSILAWNGYGWHEIFKTWATNVSIKSMFWQANYRTRSRLWFDLAGDMAYIEFPLYTANPTKDSSINFMHEGVMVSNTYDARDPQLYKIFSLLRMYSEQGSCEIDYQTNANVNTSTWTVLGTASTQPVEETTLNLGGVFKIRFRLRLQSAHSYTPNILTGWQITGRMMPLDRYQWICRFRADTTGDSNGDEPDFDPGTIYSQLQTWAKQQTKLTVRSTSQSLDNKTVTCSLPTKTIDWTDESDWGGTISVALLETP